MANPCSKRALFTAAIRRTLALIRHHSRSVVRTARDDSRFCIDGFPAGRQSAPSWQGKISRTYRVHQSETVAVAGPSSFLLLSEEGKNAGRLLDWKFLSRRNESNIRLNKNFAGGIRILIAPSRRAMRPRKVPYGGSPALRARIIGVCA